MKQLRCPRCKHRLHVGPVFYECWTDGCRFQLRKLGARSFLTTQGVIFKKSNVKLIDIWQVEDLHNTYTSYKASSRHQSQDTP